MWARAFGHRAVLHRLQDADQIDDGILPPAPPRQHRRRTSASTTSAAGSTRRCFARSRRRASGTVTGHRHRCNGAPLCAADEAGAADQQTSIRQASLVHRRGGLMMPRRVFRD